MAEAPARAEQIVYLTDWAAKNGATLQTAGQVGFGRDCVGILVDSHYVDTTDAKNATAYSHDAPEGSWWEPEDSYHKHDALAVLGHGEGALAQLHEWVRWLDAHGWRVATDYRQPDSDIDLALHGLTSARLVRAEP